MVKNNLSDCHEIQISLLKHLDEICKKNNIIYWLDGGTLLGAIRHHGFIPWDDDIDVAMPLEHYKRFISVAQKELPLDVFLQTKKTDSGYKQKFAKLRNSNSVFLEKEEFATDLYHQGIYLDIFPMVRYPSLNEINTRKLIERIQKYYQACFIDKRKKHRSFILYWINKFVWCFFSLRKSSYYANLPEDNGYLVLHDIGNLYPLKEVSFENEKYLAPSNSHQYLSDLYNNYLELPPEEKRNWHAKYISSNDACLYIKKKLVKNVDLAPVALFVYNRLENTKKTIRALARNWHAVETELYIYSDAPKTKLQEKSVLKLRKYLSKVTGFKKVVVIERKTNYYIEKNITEGVTDVINKYGKIIVLEDDVITAKTFLTYMNNALGVYEKDKKIAQISGWQIVDKLASFETTVIWRYLEIGGGWATWNDRWKDFLKYENEKDALSSLSDENKKRIEFDGAFRCLNTLKLTPVPWDISWYINIINNDQLTVNPCRSFTRNIGLYTGTHFSMSRFFIKSKFDTKRHNNYNLIFDRNIVENEVAVGRLVDFFIHKKDRLTIFGFLRRLLLNVFRFSKKFVLN